MTAVAVWPERPSPDALLAARVAAGWSPTASRLRGGDRVLGHAACLVMRADPGAPADD